MAAPQHCEVQLHDTMLAYSIPGGAVGIPTTASRVVNYRQKLNHFEKQRDSRSCLTIDAASWEFHRGTLVARWFPESVGGFSFELKINQLTNDYPSREPLDKLRQYIQDYLNQFLEGPGGYNTRIRNARPGRSDALLTDILLRMPNIKQTTLSNRKWLHFSLDHYPQRYGFTDFHFTSLNDDFALSLEMTPSVGGNKPADQEYVKKTNQQAMEMILSSVRLQNISV